MFITCEEQDYIKRMIFVCILSLAVAQLIRNIGMRARVLMFITCEEQDYIKKMILVCILSPAIAQLIRDIGMRARVLGLNSR